MSGGTDPFGREPGHDPLGDMGWTPSGAASPAPGPAPAEARETAPAAPAAGPEPRARRRGALGKLVAVVVVLGVLATIAASVVPSVLDAIEEIDSATEEVTRNDDAGDEPSSPGSSARPARGLSGGSLLRRGNLAPALRRLREVSGGGRLRFVRIAADRIDVQVLAGGGELRLAQAVSPRSARVIATTPSGGSGSTFAWESVDPSAPRRIVLATTRRAGRPASAFDYAVLVDAAGLRWSAFLRGGSAFSAEPDGRSVRRIG